MGPLSQVLVSWCTISSSLMKCKPEIWEAARGPDESGRWPRCAAKSSMLMLLSRRSVHFASPLLSLSAPHNVMDVRAWCWNSRSRSCAIPVQEWRERAVWLQLRLNGHGHSAWTGFLCVKVCPLESVAALLGLHLELPLCSLTVHLLLLYLEEPLSAA